MRTQFVNTDNVKKFKKGVIAVERRGAPEACFLVVDGQPGLGKSTAMRHWVAQNSCPYLRSKAKWDANWFLEELLNGFGCDVPHAFRKRFAAAAAELSRRLNDAMLQDRFFALVIDEADHISKKTEVMETLRDFCDVLELPIIMVGMGKLRSNLVKFPQITSRVAHYVDFQPATKQDVRAMFDGLSEVAVDDTLTDYVHRISKGYNREILEAISVVEHFGKRADLAGQPVMLAHMANQKIMNDRNTSKPIIVPEVV